MKQKILLSEFLKQKRQNVGLSQRDVATKMGYSTPQFISNWERGISHPPIKALKKLGELYKVPADDLFEVTLNTTVMQVTQDLRKKFARVK